MQRHKLIRARDGILRVCCSMTLALLGFVSFMVLDHNTKLREDLQEQLHIDLNWTGTWNFTGHEPLKSIHGNRN